MDTRSRILKKNISGKMFREAKRYIPGGVNSPVRAYKAVGGYPLFIERAKGSKIYDVDGNEYIDYLMSWGPLNFRTRSSSNFRGSEDCCG